LSQVLYGLALRYVNWPPVNASFHSNGHDHNLLVLDAVHANFNAPNNFVHGQGNEF